MSTLNFNKSTGQDKFVNQKGIFLIFNKELATNAINKSFKSVKFLVQKLTKYPNSDT